VAAAAARRLNLSALRGDQCLKAAKAPAKGAAMTIAFVTVWVLGSFALMLAALLAVPAED
jgi:hypothetical protein